MDFSETVASIGVGLILVAFLLNLAGTLERSSRFYLLMNLVGALLACLSSILIGFLPFVVLEAVWALAALVGLLHRSPQPSRA